MVPFSFLEKATIGMVKAKKVATPLPDPEISAPTEKQPKQVRVWACAEESQEAQNNSNMEPYLDTPALLHACEVSTPDRLV